MPQGASESASPAATPSSQRPRQARPTVSERHRRLTTRTTQSTRRTTVTRHSLRTESVAVQDAPEPNDNDDAAAAEDDDDDEDDDDAAAEDHDDDAAPREDAMDNPEEEEVEAYIIDSDVENLLVEDELSSDTEADRGTRESRMRIDDEVDVTGLTADEAKKKRNEYRKQRARESRKRYSDKRSSSVKAAADSAPAIFCIKSLQAVRDERLGIGNYIQVGDVFDSKHRLLHHVAELAEHYCLTLKFPRNSKVDLKAVSEDFHGTNPPPLKLHATFRVLDASWVVKEMALSGVMGQGPQIFDGRVETGWRENHSRTAFTEDQLAFHAKNPVLANPSLSRVSLVALFSDGLRFPEHITGNVWSRVRRKAYFYAYGVPNENISRLPALQYEMQKLGHHMEFDTCDGSAMVACILSEKKSECARLREFHKLRDLRETTRILSLGLFRRQNS